MGIVEVKGGFQRSRETWRQNMLVHVLHEPTHWLPRTCMSEKGFANSKLTNIITGNKLLDWFGVSGTATIANDVRPPLNFNIGGLIIWRLKIMVIFGNSPNHNADQIFPLYGTTSSNTMMLSNFSAYRIACNFRGQVDLSSDLNELFTPRKLPAIR